MKTLSAASGYIYLALLAILLPTSNVLASHIRAGEIVARSQGPQNLNYEITLKLYADRGSAVGIGSSAVLDFGDGTTRQFNISDDPNAADYITRTLVSDDTWQYELKITHSYPAAGTYTISYTENYRNAGILNMQNSAEMPFYLESIISIDPFLGPNSTPVFTRFPVDQATAGKTYHHQPGAYDADGDSLSFVLMQSLQSKHSPVKGYLYPNQAFGSGDVKNGSSETGDTPIFSINARTGDLIWDAPALEGEFSVAFVVKEWRKLNGQYYLLSAVMRDMQIMVEDGNSSAPISLSFPTADQITAPPPGEAVSWTITAEASSPSGVVVLELWGDFLSRTNAVASATRVQGMGEASITISWVGEGNNDQNYQLIARAFDPSLPDHSRNRNLYIYYNPYVLGIDDATEGNLLVYPNPLSGSTFYIDLPESTGKEIKLLIYDMNGKLMEQADTKPAPQKAYAIEANHWKPGIYLLHLYHNGRSYKQKLVVL